MKTSLYVRWFGGRKYLLSIILKMRSSPGVDQYIPFFFVLIPISCITRSIGFVVHGTFMPSMANSAAVVRSSCGLARKRLLREVLSRLRAPRMSVVRLWSSRFSRIGVPSLCLACASQLRLAGSIVSFQTACKTAQLCCVRGRLSKGICLTSRIACTWQY